MFKPMMHARNLSKLLLFLAAFATLATAIMSQPPKRLSDFDQSFYLTIAYDLDRHGTFSNGVFDKTDSTVSAPAAGMFFVPGYPLLVLAAMKMDPRFASAVACSVEANHNQRSEADCEVYARPMVIIHALLLAISVLGVAYSGELIFGNIRVFWLAGILATASFVAEAEIFSFVMTESLTIALYSGFTLFAVLAWKTAHAGYFLLAGLVLGLLCLTRPSFVVLIPVALLLFALHGRWLARQSMRSVLAHIAAFVIACLAVVGPWMLRNNISVGKWGLSEEYGSAALIERFAYSRMTVQEFLLAVPYCTPAIGDLAFDHVYGKDSMRRFVYHTKDSFFHLGRGRRDALVEQYGRLDPIIRPIAIEEMAANWWRHVLTSVPLAWCGIWVGWLWSLVLVPLFAWACVRAVRQSQPLLLLYAAPAFVMLGLHALVANHYTRYNLILIGPYAVGGAWIISEWIRCALVRARTRAPAP